MIIKIANKIIIRGEGALSSASTAKKLYLYRETAHSYNYHYAAYLSKKQNKQNKKTKRQKDKQNKTKQTNKQKQNK